MRYKRCPICELTFIPEDEEMCEMCRAKQSLKEGDPGNIKGEAEGKQPEFSSLERFRSYGTNSQNIYLKMCDAFGFDKSKAYRFGRQRPLYAECVDRHFSTDVWFLSHSMFVPFSKPVMENLDELVNITKQRAKSYDAYITTKHCNAIIGNGDYILELDDKLTQNEGRCQRDDLVFVHDREYCFFGVYRVMKDWYAMRLHKRVADRYPKD